MKNVDNKKPYETPSLTFYGDIREITKQISSQTAVADGQLSGKTH
jgi:hypothetical protein